MGKQNTATFPQQQQISQWYVLAHLFISYPNIDAGEMTSIHEINFIPALHRNIYRFFLCVWTFVFVLLIKWRWYPLSMKLACDFQSSFQKKTEYCINFNREVTENHGILLNCQFWVKFEVHKFLSSVFIVYVDQEKNCLGTSRLWISQHEFSLTYSHPPNIRNLWKD